jgi:hypothetical protein
VRWWDDEKDDLEGLVLRDHSWLGKFLLCAHSRGGWFFTHHASEY